MHTTFKIALLTTVMLLMAAGFSHAETVTKAESFALLIGTNAGGEGQQDLRFAEEDAKRVSTLIEALGQTPASNIQLVLRPTRAELEAQLDKLAIRLEKRRQQGLQSQLLVYYSGHARSNSLVLGDEEIPLTELRIRLLALKSTLTIILLDACQSGAFSRIKGVEAAEDFSVNSVNRLQAAGVAVMASSSATELSQESERLRSSFFTHHLLMGLRGAGDSDGDGRITLAEAYRYAYNTTLVDTTKTRVGTQHVTLETDIKGKGEVILSYPKTASSQLAFSKGLEATIVVQQKNSSSVVAELHKAKGNISLALPAGDYVVLVRQSRGIRRCKVKLRENQSFALQPESCEAVSAGEVATAKGGFARPQRKWALEFGAGQARSVLDRYTVDLGNDGYSDTGPNTYARTSLALVMTSRLPQLQTVLEVSNLETRTASRTDIGQGLEQELSWQGLGLTLKLRAIAVTLRTRLRWIGPISSSIYVEGGIGGAIARTTLKNSMASSTKSTELGFLRELGVGLNQEYNYGIGLYLKGVWTQAPTIDNGRGGKHDIGGIGVNSGFRYAW